MRGFGGRAAALILAIFCSAVPGAGATSQPFEASVIDPVFSWPLIAPRIVSDWRAPSTSYSAGHRGIDLAASPGQAVLAPTAGVVSFSGTVVDRPVVTLRRGELQLSFEPVSGELAVGDTVQAGQAIGRLAAGGHCATECLHFGVREAGEYVSPLRFLGALEWAVLLTPDE